MIEKIKPIKTPLRKYIIIFLLDYVALFTVIYIAFFRGSNYINPGLYFMMIFLAAYAASVSFVNDKRRAPSDREVRVLTVVCFLSVLIITALLSMLVVDYYYQIVVKYQVKSLLQDFNALGFFFLLFLGIFFVFFLIQASFGWAAQKYAKSKFGWNKPTLH